MKPPAAPAACVFGPFRFLPDSLELFRDGRRVLLPPKPAQLLRLLVSRAGQAVRRDEIVAALWPDEIVSFDKSLNFALLQLRRALEDDAREPRYVETLPRLGYRFIAPVESGTPAAWRRPRRVAPAAVGAAAAIMLLAWGMSGRQTAGIDGWRHYERASRHLQTFTTAPPVRRNLVAQAIGELEQAVAIDPGNARFWLELAHARFQLDLSPDQLRLAGVAVDRALALDTGSAGAHLRRGDLRSVLEWDWEGSREAYERAIALDPDFAEAHRHLATYYVIRGDWTRALAHSERARAIEPASWVPHTEAGWIHLYAGQFGDALTRCDRGLALDPASAHARQCVIYASAWSGDTARAAAEAARLLAARGDAGGPIAPDAAALHVFHRRYLATLGERGADRVERALALSALGEHDAAVAALEAAAADRLPQVVFRIRDPRLRPLADHPRFVALLERMGVADGTLALRARG